MTGDSDVSCFADSCCANDSSYTAVQDPIVGTVEYRHFQADFLDAQKIPDGPLLLRDWDFSSALEGHRTHKSSLIREILDAYPWLSFILIGDTSQQDPEIYRAITREYGHRILAIYIRNVDPNPGRLASVKALAAA